MEIIGKRKVLRQRSSTSSTWNLFGKHSNLAPEPGVLSRQKASSHFHLDTAFRKCVLAPRSKPTLKLLPTSLSAPQRVCILRNRKRHSSQHGRVELLSSIPILSSSEPS